MGWGLGVGGSGEMRYVRWIDMHLFDLQDR